MPKLDKEKIQNREHLTTTINKDLIKAAKIRAINEEINLNDILEDALEMYLKVSNEDKIIGNKYLITYRNEYTQEEGYAWFVNETQVEHWLRDNKERYCNISVIEILNYKEIYNQ